MDQENFERTDLEKNIKSQATWVRIAYMVLFAIAFELTKVVTIGIVIVQVLLVIVTSKPNQNLKELSASIALYCKEIILYMTYNTDAMPFPMQPWPQALNKNNDQD